MYHVLVFSPPSVFLYCFNGHFSCFLLPFYFNDIKYHMGFYLSMNYYQTVFNRINRKNHKKNGTIHNHNDSIKAKPNDVMHDWNIRSRIDVTQCRLYWIKKNCLEKEIVPLKKCMLNVQCNGFFSTILIIKIHICFHVMGPLCVRNSI